VLPGVSCTRAFYAEILRPVSTLVTKSYALALTALPSEWRTQAKAEHCYIWAHALHHGSRAHSRLPGRSPGPVSPTELWQVDDAEHPYQLWRPAPVYYTPAFLPSPLHVTHSALKDTSAALKKALNEPSVSDGIVSLTFIRKPSDTLPRTCRLLYRASSGKNRCSLPTRSSSFTRERKQWKRYLLQEEVCVSSFRRPHEAGFKNNLPMSVTSQIGREVEMCVYLRAPDQEVLLKAPRAKAAGVPSRPSTLSVCLV
jgi:hypothetical protein